MPDQHEQPTLAEAEQRPRSADERRFWDDAFTRLAPAMVSKMFEWKEGTIWKHGSLIDEETSRATLQAAKLATAMLLERRRYMSGPSLISCACGVVAPNHPTGWSHPEGDEKPSCKTCTLRRAGEVQRG